MEIDVIVVDWLTVSTDTKSFPRILEDDSERHVSDREEEAKVKEILTTKNHRQCDDGAEEKHVQSSKLRQWSELSVVDSWLVMVCGGSGVMYGEGSVAVLNRANAMIG